MSGQPRITLTDGVGAITPGPSCEIKAGSVTVRAALGLLSVDGREPKGFVRTCSI